MEGEIGHTLLTLLGTHLFWLLWGRSRSGIFCAATRISDAVRRAVRVFPLRLAIQDPMVLGLETGTRTRRSTAIHHT